jgi:tetratricopeptide (TPR) repeat protein
MAMAPNDPLTHVRVAELMQKDLPLDRQAEAIGEFETAVKLSPNDYRFWIFLGTAYERLGESDKAEQAMKRAVALAPSYAYPHWYLGNVMLRHARYDEAFAELRIAGEANAELQPQQFNLIWQVYGDDLEGLKNAVGQLSTSRSAFAVYLLSLKQFEVGLRFWNTLNKDEKRANQSSAQEMIATLNKEFKFHDALKIWNEVSDQKLQANESQIFDGGFEQDVPDSQQLVFGWRVNNLRPVQVAIDPNKRHGGKRSLRIVFQVRSDLNAATVYQLVAVQPGSQYDLECYVTTSNMETGSPPRVDILDPTTNSVLVSSESAPTNTSEWTRINLSFSTSDKTEAVIVRVVRYTCADKDTPVCPIFGSVWYDDFSLKKRN